MIEIIQQPAGVLADPEKPLFEEALFDWCLAALAEAVFDLLVRQDGLVEWAPVDGRFLPVGEPAPQELQKNPLGPLEVVRRARVHGVAPVDHHRGAVELPPKVRDVLRRQLHRVRAHLERVILRVNAESVEAQGLEYQSPAHPQIPRENVVSREREEIADVQALRRGVGEHHQSVELFSGTLDRSRVRLPVRPSRAPSRLDGHRVVARSLGSQRYVTGRGGLSHNRIQEGAGGTRYRRARRPDRLEVHCAGNLAFFLRDAQASCSRKSERRTRVLGPPFVSALRLFP